MRYASQEDAVTSRNRGMQENLTARPTLICSVGISVSHLSQSGDLTDLLVEESPVVQAGLEPRLTLSSRFS